MKYSDEQRIKKIYENAVQLHEYIVSNNIEKRDLLTNIPLQWLVTTPLYNIGEHVYSLSVEYKQAHSDVPWAMIAGLRHRLVHDYEGTNWTIIAKVIFEELPIFKEQIKELLTGAANQ